MSDITAPAAGPASGACLCGAVAFRIDGPLQQVVVCHCGMCRRWAGGPLFAAMAQSVAIEGQDNVQAYSSSDWAERAFCKNCGSGLYYRFKPQDMYILNVGLFDDADAFKLAGEIYIDSKPKGYDFAGDHERLTEAEFMAKFASG